MPFVRVLETDRARVEENQAPADAPGQLGARHSSGRIAGRGRGRVRGRVRGHRRPRDREGCAGGLGEGRSSASPAGCPVVHGDLHPANGIVRDGMIDFGEMCSGDPVTDLSAVPRRLWAGQQGDLQPGPWLGGAASLTFLEAPTSRRSRKKGIQPTGRRVDRYSRAWSRCWSYG